MTTPDEQPHVGEFEAVATVDRMRLALAEISNMPCGIPGHAVAVGCGASTVAARALAGLAGVSDDAPLVSVSLLFVVLGWMPRGKGWQAHGNYVQGIDPDPEFPPVLTDSQEGGPDGA